MPGEARPSSDVFVDGTRKECTGVIAALEKAMGSVGAGATVRALVRDVPSRIDVRAWAERKGHAILADRKEPRGFQLTIIKAGRRPA
jgi:TusA-related sulfurtransferase